MTTTTATPPTRAPYAGSDGSRRGLLALVAVSLPMFMATLDNLVMTTALPVLRTDLHASLEQLQWMVNAYTLAFASLMIAATTVGDRWGRRRIFVGGIALFALGSVGSALSTEAGTLIAFRALQGAGAAAVMPLSLTLLAAAVPAARRAVAIGIWGAVSGLGVALGPVIGGAVVDGISWEAIFWLNIPVAALAIPLILRVVPESTGRRQRLDILGLALAASGVLVTVWAIIRGNDDGWTSARVLGGIVTGAVLLGVFLVRESRVQHALVPLRLFRVRSFAVANISAFAFSIGVFGGVFLLAQYLQIGMGFTPLQAGVRTLPWTAAPMLVAPVAGVLAGRVGVRPLLTAGLALQSVGLTWQALLIGSSTTYASLVPGLALAGIGMGLTFAPAATAVLADMAGDDHGTASSVNATVREIGGALGVAVLVAVFEAAGGALTPAGYASGLRPAILVGAAIVAVGALASLAMPGSTGRGAGTDHEPGTVADEAGTARAVAAQAGARAARHDGRFVDVGPEAAQSA
jgi:EmrB/QacA subfamily drug resistance transporter